MCVFPMSTTWEYLSTTLRLFPESYVLLCSSHVWYYQSFYLLYTSHDCPLLFCHAQFHTPSAPGLVIRYCKVGMQSSSSCWGWNMDFTTLIPCEFHLCSPGLAKPSFTARGAVHVMLDAAMSIQAALVAQDWALIFSGNPTWQFCHGKSPVFRWIFPWIFIIFKRYIFCSGDVWWHRRVQSFISSHLIP